MTDERGNITGVVLAGGRGRRVGGEDKGLMQFHGRPLIAYALDALRKAAGPIFINANRNLDRYARFGYPVISDPTDGFDGPLAGLLGTMQAAHTKYILTVPCDSPMMDGALLHRLFENLVDQQCEICAAHDGMRMHPVFLIAERRLSPDLSDYLASGQRKVETWLRAHRLALADFSDQPESLCNINTCDDLAAMDPPKNPHGLCR